MSQFSKPWNELTFSDNYIFCKVMLNEDLCKRFIEILLNIKVDKIEYLNTENQIENFYEGRGIRMDVFVKDSNRTFNLEMQTGDYDSILLRARYYQSASDVATTKRRTKFYSLKESFIVFICVDDPFGQNLPVYTKKTTFLETEKIPYNDKSHIVFYNASAYSKINENEELKAVLGFIHDNKPYSDFTDKLEVSSNDAKARSEWEDDYMFFQDILEDEKEKARDEGLAEGLAEGRTQGRAEGILQTQINSVISFHKNGVSDEIIAKSLKMDLDEVNKIIAEHHE